MDDDLYQEQKVPPALITGIKFDVATEAEIEKISALEITAAGQVTCPDLGLPNPSSECSTCGSKDRKSCEGHFGVIKFPFAILHPYFLSEIAQILNKICPSCKSIRQELRNKVAHLISKNNQPKGCRYCVGSLQKVNGLFNKQGTSRDWYPAMKFKVSSYDLFRRTAIIVEISEKLPKHKNLVKLAADYWDFIPQDSQQDESCIRPNRRVLSPAQVYHLLSGVEPKFIQKFVSRMDLLSLSCFPVTPNCHRVTEMMHASSNGNRLIFGDRTREYKRLVDFRGKADELSSRVLDCLRISKLNPDKTPSNSFADIQQKKNAENSCNAFGLRWMKDVVLGKRNDHSFRTVVIGDPDLKPREIGIPCQIAENLQVSEYVNRHNKERLLECCAVRMLEKGHIDVRRNGNLLRLRKKKELQIGDIIYRPLGDGDTVLINRPPSIHQHSLITLYVKVLPINSVVSINPVCCSPLRGDFDGDCLHGYIPQSIGARVELDELVALDRQLINGQSGRNLLSLGQDSLTAAYLLMEDEVNLNTYQMQQLQMFCPHNMALPAIVKSPSASTSFWTGKQLFSMLLPHKFSYTCPSNNIVIIDGEIISSSEGSSWLRDSDGNLFQSLLRHYQGKTLEFLYSAQKVLCEWLSMMGFSVSIADLYLSPDPQLRKNMMDEIFYGLQEVEFACKFKQFLVDYHQESLSEHSQGNENFVSVEVEHLNYERQISAALSQASVDAFRQIFRDIQSLAYKYAHRDNNLITMIKAGSKGNLLKLVQHAMCLGLQHSLVRLPFRIPHELTCAAWNRQKRLDSTPVQSHIPYAVVENSFLTGLNPLECFVHSVTSRDSSFSDNADLPGTLSRRLMFFMRDLYVGYEGTVRNSYGNQLIQFSYDTSEDSFSSCSSQECTGGHPVGALSACAISEAAYGALDQPISLLETSPLLNLKYVLECGSRNKRGEQIVSLYLSEKLGKQRHGFEYGSLEVKNHLERLMFSDIVSTVMIMYTPKTSSQVQFCPWVVHFHVRKEILRRRNLKVHSIIHSLYQRCDSLITESKVSLPSLQISSGKCSMDDMPEKGEDTFCITATILENSKNSVQLDAVRDLLIPFLLGTAIKGFLEIKKVNILWNNRSKVSKANNGPIGELYLRVTMSADCGSRRFWSVLMNHCLPIMDLIDWKRSHPDSIRHFCSAYGIDAGWKYFLHNLESAISDTGKTILPEHLLLVANSLSATGEFVSLNAKGMAKQMQHASVSSPFVQACFSNPGSCFIKAAKAGIEDDLRGSIDALAWGNCPSMGTGGQFDLIYSEKGHEIAKPADIYNLLKASFEKPNEKKWSSESQNYLPNKWSSQFRKRNAGFLSEGLEKLESISKSVVSKISADDIRRLAIASKRILHKYPINEQLSETDKATIMMALRFHPNKDEKIGDGAQEIKVGYHPKYTNTRCFLIERTDGTYQDFSYHKCILGALESVAPDKAKIYKDKKLRYGDKSSKRNNGGTSFPFGSCTFSN